MLLVLRPADGSDSDEVSDVSGLDCGLDGKGRTKQEFAEECDINTIIDRFGIGYQVPENVKIPLIGDFTEAGDFFESMELIRTAQDGFMQMSAETRSRFGNNAGKFVEYVSEVDEGGKLRHLDELRRLGLAVPEVVPEPERVMKVEVVAPPGGAPKGP